MATTTMTAPSLPLAPGLRRVVFTAMGTRCEIQYHAGAGAQPTAFETAAVRWVQAFEAKYSRFRETSLLSRINTAAGLDWVEVDAEMERMLDICETIFVMSRGLLDVTALPLLRLWNYRDPQADLPSIQQVAAARQLVGWRKVQRAPGKIFLPARGMALDFGGFGKEYAVDMVAEIAGQHGIRDVLVDFGHDLRALGAPPGRPCWHIGLENPERPGTHSGSIGVTGRGVASSGDYLRCIVRDGKRYGHIVDPRTGLPCVSGCTQATVVADTCLQAGVLSTVAFMMGLQEGPHFIQSFPGAEGLLTAAHCRAQTRGFYDYVVTG